MLAFTVAGVPAPQGSKSRMPNGGLVESSKRVAMWRESVRWEAVHAVEAQHWDETEGPFGAVLVFTVRRPGHHFGTGRNAGVLKPHAPAHPAGRPDVDKLARAVLDALSDSGAIVDDSQIVTLTATKCYPGGHLDALDGPGAAVTLWRLE